MKGRLLIYKMQSQISNTLSVLNCLYRDRSFINLVTSHLLINLRFKLCALVNYENLSHGHNVILWICVCDSSAGIAFFNDKTEAIKRC